MIKNIIVWDLGATKCAAGLIEFNDQTQELICIKQSSIKLSDTTSFEDLISKVELTLGLTLPAADAVCIGGAGFYNGEELLLEGVYPYRMLFAEIAKKQNWPSYAVIHDYAPIVCATFTSYIDNPKNIKPLNSAKLNPAGRRVALGIGTGLGLKDGVLLPDGDFWLGQNEIGHIGIVTPPHADKSHLQRHFDFKKFLHEKNNQSNRQPLTFEKVLSGPGTVRLHQFLYPNSSETTPEGVGKSMREGRADELLDMFAWYMGLFIGTVQLIFMPEGGIWITGGVALNHLDAFDRSEFADGIASSPAYMVQREQYPLNVLCSPEHALIGGGYYAMKRLLKI